jgi:hypothetical protein
MSIARVLSLSTLIGLAACSSPTAPAETQRAITPPAASSPGGHSQQFGPPCGTTGRKVLCSGRN